MTSGPDETAAFCATLVDEWVRAGVTDAVVCPGSRSTPLALALAVDGRLDLHVHHDERSGGFLALGIGLGSGRPAVIVTTSGTAAAELHPAVVEAHQARVPLIVATADRPPELQDVGAPQTIDQTHLFGPAVRWFCEPGVPDTATEATWRPLAGRSVISALGPVPGPVHLNLAFREPLVGQAAPLPAGRDGGRPWTVVGWPDPRPDLEPLVAMLASGVRGVVVAGAGTTRPAAVHALAGRLGWPVVADPRSGARTPAATTVAAADALLRHPATARDLAPDVVIRLGEPPVSKVVNRWLEGSGAWQVLVHRHGPVVDPEGRLGLVLAGDPGEVCGRLLAAIGPDWTAPDGWLPAWATAEAATQEAVTRVLGAHAEPTEPAIARSVVAALPDGSTLVASSSMPIRDVEWYGAPRDGIRVVANRGANGIDGVTSTAVGVAIATAAPTVLLIGDVAFLHDTNGLLGLATRPVDLTIVVVDNDGGGIFSFLPQREALAQDRFEQLFGTPHGVDLGVLAAAHALPVATVADSAALGPAVADAVSAGGVRVVLVRTDRDANVAIHDEVHAAVAGALA